MNATVGSLFSGFGGLDLGVAAAIGDTRTVWVCDIEPGPRAILATRYPDAPNLRDITTIDWDAVEPVDVICGGSPCQDLSLAGRRAGMHDGTRSGLWESMLAGISAIRPQLVIWENVRGALSASAHSNMESEKGYMGDRTNRPSLRALGRVLGDLANIGYDAQWTSIRASDVGAPHRRERVFIVAHPESQRRFIPHGNDAVTGRADSATFSQWRQPTTGEEKSRRTWTDAGRPDRTPVRLFPTPRASDGEKGGPNQHRSRGDLTISSAAHLLLPTPTARDGKGANQRRDASCLTGALLPTPATANRTNRSASPGANIRMGLEELDRSDRFGPYAQAVSRWEIAIGRPAPNPTEHGPRGGMRLSATFVEWMMGLPEGWVTDIGISRTQQLRALGNGVVPQQAAQAIAELLTIATQALGAA